MSNPRVSNTHFRSGDRPDRAFQGEGATIARSAMHAAPPPQWSATCNRLLDIPWVMVAQLFVCLDCVTSLYNSYVTPST